MFVHSGAGSSERKKRGPTVLGFCGRALKGRKIKTHGVDGRDTRVTWPYRRKWSCHFPLYLKLHVLCKTDKAVGTEEV